MPDWKTYYKIQQCKTQCTINCIKTSCLHLTFFQPPNIMVCLDMIRIIVTLYLACRIHGCPLWFAILVTDLYRSVTIVTGRLQLTPETNRNGLHI